MAFDATTSDETIALAAARDEAGAFAELLRRYQVPLFRFLRRFSPRVQDAEDLLQETVFRLYASRGKYKSRWAFRTWAFTIARRAAIDAHRKKLHDVNARAESVGERSAVFFADSSRHESDVSEGIWEVARQILTREQADALWLFHVEGVPPREIAKIFDRSWVSVKTMLHRARKQVRAAIDEQLGRVQLPDRVSGGAS